MARPRNILINSFPPGTVTPEQASDALRKSGGDVERAKKLLEEAFAKPKNAADHHHDDNNESKPTAASTTTKPDNNKQVDESADAVLERLPPRSVASINNLSDRQYCCVWHVEVLEDGYRPEVARALLAKVARHVNPILRDRGWRVKRLMESASRKWIGCCTGNGRDDADAASTNIQLNLRADPNKHCKVFRSFEQIMGVMLHEITHTSIGLEDIHPPAFYELLNEIRREYRAHLENGNVKKETDDYGCNNTFVTSTGQVATVGQAASSVVTQDGNVPLFASNEECGATKQNKRRRRRWRGGGKKRSAVKAMGTVALEKQQKRRPLLKGAKMIDKRTKGGKAAMAEQASLSARELAARAALARFGGGNTANGEDANDKKENEANAAENSEESSQEELLNGDESESESDDDEFIASHKEGCKCRSCEWEHMLSSVCS